MSKKQKFNLIALLVIIAGSTLILIQRYNNKSMIKDFAVKDTTSITRIFLSDKQNHNITLDKKNGTWLVNGKYEAEPQKLKLLMEAIQRVSVKSLVPLNEHADIIKIMNTSSVKVMIYSGGKLITSYFVGDNTADHLGTYYCKVDSDEPMICEITGFNGFLTPRFITNEIAWRTRAYYRYGPGDIGEIKVTYTNDKKNSFTYDVPENTLVNEEGKRPDLFDTKKAAYYVNLFSNLDIEGFDSKSDAAFADSLAKTTPYCIISIKDKNGKTNVTRLYLKKLFPADRYDRDGKLIEFDTDRYYAINDGDKSVIMLVQIFNFGKVLKDFEYFNGPA